jgi:hypothetical protein
MRCKACNSILGPHSIKWNNQIKDYEVCHTCHTIVREVLETHEVIDRAKLHGIGYELEAE